jgi:hypothetical protein
MYNLDLDKIREDIYALYDACILNAMPFHQKIDLFIVPDKLVETIFEATGIDVSGHWVCIDNYGILHALEEHGSILAEAKRGQIALEKEDFNLFLDVFLNPDIVKHVGFTKRTMLPLIQFEKWLEDRKIVVKEVRTITSKKKNKISRLVFHTMYKIRKSSK